MGKAQGRDKTQSKQTNNKQTNKRAFHIRSDDIQTNKLLSSKLDSTEEKYIKLKRCTCPNPRQKKRTFDDKFSKCPLYDPSTGYVKNLNLINRSSCLGLAGPLTVLTVPMGQLTRVRDGVTELGSEAGV